MQLDRDSDLLYFLLNRIIIKGDIEKLIDNPLITKVTCKETCRGITSLEITLYASRAYSMLPEYLKRFFMYFF